MYDDVDVPWDEGFRMQVMTKCVANKSYAPAIGLVKTEVCILSCFFTQVDVSKHSFLCGKRSIGQIRLS